MNFRALFCAGLVLSLAGFTLDIYYYTFQYSALGYGLMLVSFLFKRIETLDWVWIALIASTAAAILLTQNEWAFVFEALFVLVFGAYHLATAESRIARIFSVLSILLAVCATGLLLALIIGFGRAATILDPLVIAMVLAQAIQVIANKKWA
ncbi:MAG: hypothetical protein A2Y33_04150 [Spirochaetes bacterium GWF1_51_8]|nr:MAG: hypothetical protein A2Y33_04150 [Spirochaetes bacterium GWF1_51_8]